MKLAALGFVAATLLASPAPASDLEKVVALSPESSEAKDAQDLLKQFK